MMILIRVHIVKVELIEDLRAKIADPGCISAHIGHSPPILGPSVCLALLRRPAKIQQRRAALYHQIGDLRHRLTVRAADQDHIFRLRGQSLHRFQKIVPAAYGLRPGDLSFGNARVREIFLRSVGKLTHKDGVRAFPGIHGDADLGVGGQNNAGHLHLIFRRGFRCARRPPFLGILCGRAARAAGSAHRDHHRRHANI